MTAQAPGVGESSSVAESLAASPVLEQAQSPVDSLVSQAESAATPLAGIEMIDNAPTDVELGTGVDVGDPDTVITGAGESFRAHVPAETEQSDIDVDGGAEELPAVDEIGDGSGDLGADTLTGLDDEAPDSADTDAELLVDGDLPPGTDVNPVAEGDTVDATAQIAAEGAANAARPEQVDPVDAQAAVTEVRANANNTSNEAVPNQNPQPVEAPVNPPAVDTEGAKPSDKYPGLTKDEETKFDALKNNPDITGDPAALAEYNALSSKHAEAKQMDEIKKKIQNGEQLSEADNALLNKKKETGTNASEQGQEAQQLTDEQKLQNLSDETAKLTQEMMEGKNFAQNKARLEQIRKERGEIRERVGRKRAIEAAQKRKEMGETRYQQEARMLEAQMQMCLQEMWQGPKNMKILKDRRKKLLAMYKQHQRQFKIDKNNAQTEKAAEHYKIARERRRQIINTNVAIAEAKYVTKTSMREFKQLQNRIDRLAGAKGFWNFVGNEAIKRIQQEMDDSAIDQEARRIAASGE